MISFHFGKQCLRLFLFKADLGCIEINVSQTRNPIPQMLNQYQRNSLKQCFTLISVKELLLCVVLGRYQTKSDMPRCFMGYLYSLNFVKSQIIPSINQSEIKPCLRINEPQKLNKASKGSHTEVWVRLDVP